MTWRVRLFAYLKDNRGSEIEVESDPSTLALCRALADKGLPVEHCRLAVNNEFVLDDVALQGSETLALIPPVSGG